MNLPFQINKSRRFQCFICGVQFLEFEEYKGHIIEKHEEGRDYVMCPCTFCAAPVRDIRSHFRVKHPGLPIPNASLMKAVIWRDIQADGKIKTKKKFREGNYTSIKMGKDFHFRSGWEATVYECLDSWNKVVAFEAEPFKIPYIHEAQQHEYTPDIFIAFMDGHKEIWEIKPISQTGLQKNQDKWFAAQRACEARGWKFEVITEQVIERLKKTIKNQHLENEPDDNEYLID